MTTFNKRFSRLLRAKKMSDKIRFCLCIHCTKPIKKPRKGHGRDIFCSDYCKKALLDQKIKQLVQPRKKSAFAEIEKILDNSI